MDGAAIASRFVVSKLNAKCDFKDKKKRTKEILSKGIMDDPGRYRRRIFSMLPTIEKNITFLKRFIFEVLGNQRQGDNLAPLIAVVYAVQNEGYIEDNEDFQKNVKSWITEEKESIDDDEDILVKEIFMILIRVDSEEMSIGELVNKTILHDPTKGKIEAITRALGNYGIRILKKENKIAIGLNNKSLKDKLKDTFYQSNYGEVLMRHEHVLEEQKIIKINSVSTRCVTLNLDLINKDYFD